MHPPSGLVDFRKELEGFTGDYEAAKRFSSEWDIRFGYQKGEIEAELARRDYPAGEEPWIGLPLPSLETPYPELFRIFQNLYKDLPNAFQTIDLGAAYGRLGIVQSLFDPRSNFCGYEIVRSRADEGNRIFHDLALTNAEIRTENLADVTQLPEANLYFIYDLGSVDRIRSLLALLQERALHQGIIVAGRGRATRNLIESNHPWLSQVQTPVHFENLSIYFSREREGR